MLKGRIKEIENTQRKFGEANSYFILKIEADYNSQTEEYILLTKNEYSVALQRAEKNTEDLTNKKIGIHTVVNNNNRKFGAASQYIAINVIDEEGKRNALLLTGHGLERARVRAEKNKEDIAIHKTGWLLDLFD
jgi:hypothetical protein